MMGVEIILGDGEGLHGLEMGLQELAGLVQDRTLLWNCRRHETPGEEDAGKRHRAIPLEAKVKPGKCGVF